jgi:FPC/CPF motif-containing protein YcgG
MSMPTVAEALANRKADEAPIALAVTFDPEHVHEELARIGEAQCDYEITKNIERYKGGSSC